MIEYCQDCGHYTIKHWWRANLFAQTSVQMIASKVDTTLPSVLSNWLSVRLFPQQLFRCHSAVFFGASQILRLSLAFLQHMTTQHKHNTNTVGFSPVFHALSCFPATHDNTAQKQNKQNRFLTSIPCSLLLSCNTTQDSTGRQAGRHDWFYYTSTKCAIPDDMDSTNTTQTQWVSHLYLCVSFGPHCGL